MLHFRGKTLKLIYVTRKAIGGMNSSYFVGQSRNWTTLPGSCIEPFASVGLWEFETVLSKGLQSSCLCGVPGISFLGFPSNRPQHTASSWLLSAAPRHHHPHAQTQNRCSFSSAQRLCGCCMNSAAARANPTAYATPLLPVNWLLNSVLCVATQHSLPRQLYCSNPT